MEAVIGQPGSHGSCSTAPRQPRQMQVRRRNNGNVRAEPPPSQPAQAKTTNQAKPNQGRKKQTNGFNDDDDSDSDRDRSQRDFGDRDRDVIVRKKNQPLLASNRDLEVRPKHSVAGPSTSTPLTPQEEQRVQLQRQITRQRETHEGVWEHFLLTRRDNIRSTWKDKGRLLHELQNDPKGQQLLLDNSEAIPVEKQWPNTHVFEFQKLQMSHYLDEALCHDIADRDAMEDNNYNYLSEGISKLELLEDIIKEAETKFVLWWEQFVTPGERTVQAVVESLWTQDTWIYRCRAQSQGRAGEGLGLGAFAASYEQWILTQLGFSFIFDVRSIGSVLEQHSMCEWRKSDRGMSKYLDIIKILSESRRQNQRLSQEYIDWICSGISPDLIASYCQQRLQQIRGAKIRDMLESTSTRQEFCEDIDYEGSLSLVLFKGGMPFSIKPVSHLDREQMGWHRRQRGHVGQWNSKFHRYEIDNRYGHTFKVGVNGELLALWTPRGEASWVEKHSGPLVDLD
ncbi:hypothetical protein CHU98_g7301 [Xylaria longipes]|nr:hypothetical protein CHU98_g7301 [Xylaria longipes]